MLGAASRVRLIAAACAALLGSSWVLATAPAQASTGVKLLRYTQIFGLANVVTDPLDGWLLIASVGVSVTDLQGAPIATLLPKDDIAEVQLSPDGRFAWAADVTTHALDRIDLSDLSIRAYALPVGDAPTGVVPISSRWIVFSHTWTGDPSTGPAYGGLGVLDTSSGAVWRRPAVLDVASSPVLRLIPSTRRVLDADGGDPQTVSVYDFATGRPVLSGQPGVLTDPCTLADLAVSPDGQSFVPACSNGTKVTEYRTADVSVKARYTINPGLDWVPYIDAVAYSGDGSMLAVGQQGVYANNLTVLKRSASGWQGWYGKHLPFESITDARGVVFSPDSTSIYVLGEYVGAKSSEPISIGSAPGMDTSPIAPTAMLTASSPATAYVGDTVAVTGTLQFSDTADADAGADRVITITRTLNGVGTTVKETTDTSGRFTFLNTPMVPGNATWTVRYDADGLHAATSATTTTVERKRTTVLTLTETGAVIDAGYVVTATAHLGPTYTNRTVTLSLNGDVLTSGPVDADGNLTASTPPQQCEFSFPCYIEIKASFAGDSRYLPAEADSP